MAKKVDPRWTRLANKLRNANKQLTDAQAAHAKAVKDAEARLDAAEANLAKAIKQVQTLIKEVAETPPGTFPAITD